MPQHHNKHTTSAGVASHDNSHTGTVVSDEAIRLCAHRKWAAAGYPTGDGVRFWLEAERELMEAKTEKSARREGPHDHQEQERVEAVKASNANNDNHYRDNNRMFQDHGDRGHRHDGR